MELNLRSCSCIFLLWDNYSLSFFQFSVTIKINVCIATSVSRGFRAALNLRSRFCIYVELNLATIAIANKIKLNVCLCFTKLLFLFFDSY